MPGILNKAVCSSLMLALSLVSVDGLTVTYTWVDKNGVTHFSQHPPPSQDAADAAEPELNMPETGNAGQRLDTLKDNLDKQRRIRFQQNLPSRED